MVLYVYLSKVLIIIDLAIIAPIGYGESGKERSEQFLVLHGHKQTMRRVRECAQVVFKAAV